MRYWKGYRMDAEDDFSRWNGLADKEACMDKCLQNPRCISFSFDIVENKNKCLLQAKPKKLVKGWHYYSGVRCDQDFAPKPEKIEGKYPAVPPPPGKI